jgi:hypothetical protein
MVYPREASPLPAGPRELPISPKKSGNKSLVGIRAKLGALSRVLAELVQKIGRFEYVRLVELDTLRANFEIGKAKQPKEFYDLEEKSKNLTFAFGQVFNSVMAYLDVQLSPDSFDETARVETKSRFESSVKAIGDIIGSSVSDEKTKIVTELVSDVNLLTTFVPTRLLEINFAASSPRTLEELRKIGHAIVGLLRMVTSCLNGLEHKFQEDELEVFNEYFEKGWRQQYVDTDANSTRFLVEKIRVSQILNDYFGKLLQRWQVLIQEYKSYIPDIYNKFHTAENDYPPAEIVKLEEQVDAFKKMKKAGTLDAWLQENYSRTKTALATAVAKGLGRFVTGLWKTSSEAPAPSATAAPAPSATAASEEQLGKSVTFETPQQVQSSSKRGLPPVAPGLVVGEIILPPTEQPPPRGPSAKQKSPSGKKFPGVVEATMVVPMPSSPPTPKSPSPATPKKPAPPATVVTAAAAAPSPTTTAPYLLKEQCQVAQGGFTATVLERCKEKGIRCPPKDVIDIFAEIDQRAMHPSDDGTGTVVKVKPEKWAKDYREDWMMAAVNYEDYMTKTHGTSSIENRMLTAIAAKSAAGSSPNAKGTFTTALRNLYVAVTQKSNRKKLTSLKFDFYGHSQGRGRHQFPHM